jgi:hypothetical protein
MGEKGMSSFPGGFYDIFGWKRMWSGAAKTKYRNNEVCLHFPGIANFVEKNRQFC